MKKLRLGLIGLGGATVTMLPKLVSSPLYDITAAADADRDILGKFKRDFPNASPYGSVEAVCNSDIVDLVYIATPNRFHKPHAVMALDGGKHVLIEKPMATTLEDADAMVAAARRNDRLLAVNVKHSFEPRIQQLREWAKSGDLGQLRMLHHWRYQDWLYRPRTPEELTPEWGGGILWRQGSHQFDLLRTIGGGLMRSVRGTVGAWDPKRGVAGAHVAYFEFENDACGTAVYSGFDHYDSNELVRGLEEQQTKSPETYAKARRELLSQEFATEWEIEAARSERYGGVGDQGVNPASTRSGGEGSWLLGGPLIATFDHGDVRLSPQGLKVYDDDRQWELPLSMDGDGRDVRLRTLYHAIRHDAVLPADGQWGKATIEVLLAIEESSRTKKEIALRHQIGYPD